MAELKDSGTRRNFETGAVRDRAEGKGRCDLLPLGVIGEYLLDPILLLIENYVRSGDCADLFTALERFGKEQYGTMLKGGCIYDVLLEAAKQYEDGIQKYGDRNWEKGIPLHCFIDSATRHYLKQKRGDVDEPHDRAFAWNMLGAIWTHKNKPELIDLPFAEKENAV